MNYKTPDLPAPPTLAHPSLLLAAHPVNAPVTRNICGALRTVKWPPTLSHTQQDQVDGDGTDEGVLVKDEDLRVQDLQERKGADDDYKARLLAFQGEEEMASILEGVPDPSEYDEFGDR